MGLEAAEDDTDRECFSAHLGVISVADAERVMTIAAKLRLNGFIPDVVQLMAHPRTVALGLKGRHDEHPKDLLVGFDVLASEGIDFVRSTRGGGITYHWPGQVVCYPVLALESAERNIPRYMTKLEEVGLRTLARFGVEATRRRDTNAYVGLWHERGKIVSMGVRVSHWVTAFGFALNLEGDVTPSRFIRPCGIEGAKLTTMQEILGTAPPRQEVVEAIEEEFASVFGRALKPIPPELSTLIISGRR
ncbi:MAG: lipoyl(octanoyl) transferase LipB [Pseudomonadota bacterium]